MSMREGLWTVYSAHLDLGSLAKTIHAFHKGQEQLAGHDQGRWPTKPTVSLDVPTALSYDVNEHLKSFIHSEE